jgi:hypothetical protein
MKPRRHIPKRSYVFKAALLDKRRQIIILLANCRQNGGTEYPLLSTLRLLCFVTLPTKLAIWPSNLTAVWIITVTKIAHAS